MNYAIGIGTVLGCFLLANAALNQEIVRKCKYLRPRIPDEQIAGMQLTAWQIRGLSLLVALGAAVAVWRLTVSVHDTLNLLKMATALVILTGCACVDGIEHRIPNFFTGLLALLALAFLAAGFLTGQEGAFGYLNSSIFAAVASAIVLIIGMILSHQGIGFGDIKLITALGLTGGVYITGGTLFFGILLCALASGCLLLTKKKTMKESVPFGPFLFIGYLLTVCFLKF